VKKQRKICNLLDAKLIVNKWKSFNETVVFTNGCFDVFHYGHLNLLYHSKKLGHKLVIGLNDDHSIQKLKGKERPIHNQEQRVHMLSSLIFVDLIILFSEETPIKIIKELMPSVLTKGADYSINEIVGKDEVIKSGGKVILIPLIKGLSSSKIIKDISYGK